MSRDLSGRTRPFGFFGGVLAFGLSAALGIAFLGLVIKTHDLFAGAAFTEPTVVGTWQGQWHDLPAVTLTIGHEGDQLTGTVLFQPIVKTEQGASIKGAPVTVQVKDARFDGKTLRFRFDGKTLRFRLDDSLAARELRDSGIVMTLTNAGHAQLRLATCAYEVGSECEEVVMTKTA